VSVVGAAYDRARCLAHPELLLPAKEKQASCPGGVIAMVDREVLMRERAPIGGSYIETS